MTDEELKALVAENSAAVAKNSAAVAENSAAVAKNNAAIAENSAAVRQLREDSDRRWDESRRETERIWQEIMVSRQETDRLITSFNRELGRLGNKLGDYTESLFRPSLERVLRERFGMTVIAAPQRIERDGEHLEIDMVGTSGDESRGVYLVEIKSQLRQEGIDQLLRHLRQFPQFFPEHRGKKIYGILAALDVPPDLRIQVHREGLYLATIRDDVFELSDPDDFTPRAFGIRQA